MSEQIQQPLDENTASQRHWLYGFNAGVLVLVSLVVLIFLAKICESDFLRNRTKFDISTGGLNSLSPGSQKMLGQIDSKPEQYTLWSLFTDPSDQLRREKPEEANKQAGERRQINDLLQLYRRASAKITVEDRGDAAWDIIERQIRDKYQADFKPYQEAVDAFDPLAKKLTEFLKTEAEAVGAFAQTPGTPPDEAAAAATIQAWFASVPVEMAQEQRLIHREVDQNSLPDWGGLKDAILSRIDDIESRFAVLGDAEKLKSAVDTKKLPPTLGVFFTGRFDRYKSIEGELKGYKTQLDELKPLKVQDILANRARDSVIIMAPDAAKVISYGELYTEASTGGRSTDTGVSFNGEQAISSALYAMANPDKVKVVFVTASPQRILEDYSDLKQTLQDANFDVQEWSPPGPNTPEATMPPLGRGVVWIVFPPETPSFQMMMQGMRAPDPQPVINATRRHMDKGGQVLFLAEAGGGGNPLAPGGGAYPYADLIKDFGIEVQNKYSIQHEQVSTDPDTRQPVRQNSPFVGLEPELQPLYAKHEITTPVEGLPIIFGPMLTNQGPVGASTVVKVLNPVPAGVEALELIKTPYSPEFWASTDSSPKATFDKTKDLASPVPLMAIAVKDKGKKGSDGTLEEKRIAVLGTRMLGSDFFLKLNVRVLYGGVPMLMRRFPGNSEMMKNTVLWLSGYENMIAVSAKADASARIGNVSPMQRTMVQLLVLLLVPGAALVLLVIVWTVRHR